MDEERMFMCFVDDSGNHFPVCLYTLCVSADPNNRMTGDQSDSLINSSRTAELELEKRDRFLEGVGSY